jgi:hypothetical protein
MSPLQQFALPNITHQRPSPHHSDAQNVPASCIIVRFTSDSPIPKHRMTAVGMHDTINATLANARIRVSGAYFNRTGNIIVTPLAPCTTFDILRHADILKECVAHEQHSDSMVVEGDSPWHNVVALHVQIPQNAGDIWEAEQTLCGIQCYMTL